jgi:F-type H+-transporting ATPase subunit c
MKRTSTLMNSARTQVSTQAKRAYSSEMANALVQVSQNLGMGSAAIGLGGAGIGIGKDLPIEKEQSYIRGT